MLYFNKTYILDNQEKQNLEKGLRSHSLKRNKVLDMVFETSNIGSDKYFFGKEDKNNLKFTRIKTSFESFLPKVIVSFPKEISVDYYKFRLSALSTVICCFLSLFLLIAVFGLIKSKVNLSDFFTSIVLFFGYFSFIVLEIKLTKNRIKKSYKVID